MKQNKNNITVKDYYIGLDPGSASCGWAVTDHNYNLAKFKGNDMWGVRLFEEAETAEGRRLARGQRRRLDRRNARLNYLEILFNNEINEVDPTFFRRLRESNLWQEDKGDNTCKYSLFNDENYTDYDYLRDYPTIYHLRSELITSKEPHDIRLVYLAIHHILKNRGHFLYESSGDEHEKSFDESFDDLKIILSENLDIDFKPLSINKFEEALFERCNISTKKEKLKEAYGEYDKSNKQLTAVLDLLAGGTVKFEVLFNDENYKDIDIKSISLKDDFEEKYDSLSSDLDESELDILFAIKETFDIVRLNQVLGKEEYISNAKKKLYEKNKEDLKLLKEYVKNNYSKDEYDYIFNKKDMIEKWNRDTKYDIYLAPDVEGMNKKKIVKSQKSFCALLKKKLTKLKDESDENLKRIYSEIESGDFLTKLRGVDNGLIPYQTHLKELNKILENASSYLPFLNEVDEDKMTNIKKIKSLFKFKIPYYVGPLGKNANHGSLAKNESAKGKRILPWNFDEVVDKKQSSEKFMNNLIGRCTYTGDRVLPKDSLIYSRYMLLNELNNLKVNGNPITTEAKEIIIVKLFENSSKSVTIKNIHEVLKDNGFIRDSDEISGVDEKIKSSLKSYHDFKSILKRTNDEDMVENIIEHIVVFGNDKRTLKKWIEENCNLKDDEIKKIVRLKYKDWGRLSKYFLKEMKCEDPETHVKCSIIDELERNSINLMMLLSDKYQYAKEAQKYREENYYANDDAVSSIIDDFYISPSTKRSIRQSIRLVDEIVDINKGAPSKIFVEMARDVAGKNKKERTKSRKESLLELYKSCEKQIKDIDTYLYGEDRFDEMYERLNKETDKSLKRDKLYFYYTQFGRCMYSLEPIDLEKCLKDNKTYDIDHIFPQSKIKDNSLDNRVLVKSELNREKTNSYPINDSIRNKMHAFWKMLKEKGLISKKKYERLIRCVELTNEELKSFAARQLVETRQSTKAIATIFKKLYPNTKIVYSKAGNVSEFRQEFQIPKYRDVNDLHHAKDAYLNIVVGNVYDTKITSKFLDNIRYENYSLTKMFDYNVNNAWIAPTKEEISSYRKHQETKDADIHTLSGTFKTVYKNVFKNTPIVTYATKGTGEGLLFKLTIQKKGEGSLPIKKGLSTEKYGGYILPSVGYFLIAKYGKTKKQVSIFPVDLINVNVYEKDPIGYCKDILKLDNPEIIVNKVCKNAIFELDNVRYIISAKNNKDKNGVTSDYYFANAYQLVIDDNRAKYLKQLQKIYAVSDEKNKELAENDIVSSDKNSDLYRWYLNKLENSIYAKVYPKEKDILIDSYEKFLGLSLFSQVNVLLNILKMFSCKNEGVNVEGLGIGTKNKFGIIIKSKILSKYSSAYLINQSVTGLYETKIDLLRE